MSKHTPGPWTVEPPSGRQPRTTIWKWHPKRAFGENVWVATIYGGEVSDDESEANARLIAAAPALLDAARRVVSGVPHPDGGRVILEADVLALAAVIAKAEG